MFGSVWIFSTVPFFTMNKFTFHTVLFFSNKARFSKRTLFLLFRPMHTRLSNRVQPIKKKKKSSDMPVSHIYYKPILLHFLLRNRVPRTQGCVFLPRGIFKQLPRRESGLNFRFFRAEDFYPKRPELNPRQSNLSEKKKSRSFYNEHS